MAALISQRHIRAAALTNRHVRGGPPFHTWDLAGAIRHVYCICLAPDELKLNPGYNSAVESVIFFFLNQGFY
jgi:hypothetical protein